MSLTSQLYFSWETKGKYDQKTSSFLAVQSPTTNIVYTWQLKILLTARLAYML